MLDHCGNPKFQEDISAWKADVEAISSRTNLVCKVSGFVANATRDDWDVEELAVVVNHVWSSFGPERLVFGSDWPVVNLKADYGRWVGALRSIVSERPLAEQKMLFSGNAERVYRLS